MPLQNDIFFISCLLRYISYHYVVTVCLCLRTLKRKTKFSISSVIIPLNARSKLQQIVVACVWYDLYSNALVALVSLEQLHLLLYAQMCSQLLFLIILLTKRNVLISVADSGFHLGWGVFDAKQYLMQPNCGIIR